jgi:hypothetical protein
MAVGIDHVEVRRNGERIEDVQVFFGDGHELRLIQRDGKVRCQMDSGHVSAILDASGPGCDFERAVNLLRLHLRHVAQDETF